MIPVTTAKYGPAAALRSSCSNISTTAARPAAPARSHRRQLQVHAADVNCRDVVAVRKEVQSQGKVFKVTFLGSGSETREIQCPDDMYILDAAEQQGLDLPATCRGGICGACVARVGKGTVDMSDIPDLSFTLDEDEQAAGMTLLCMARATSDIEVETQCDWGYSLGVADWKGASGRFSATPDPLMGTEWNKNQAAAAGKK